MRGFCRLGGKVTSESTKAPQIANFTKNLILNYGKE